ncbi:hypothetical protein J7L29_01525 [Candidatus Bathyarchaeota archaeon]|nr:hypothetical protein [Candidatus Bathyarchaeota archaeon]
MAKAVAKLHGDFENGKTAYYGNVYVTLEVNQYHVDLYAGYVLGGKKTFNILGFSVPPPNKLTGSYVFGDQTARYNFEVMDNPYPKDDAIEKAQRIMISSLEAQGYSKNEILSSIDHVYAEMEFLSRDGDVVIPVWHIVFYFKHDIGDAYAYSVTLDASNGNLIGAEPLYSPYGSNHDGISGHTKLIVLLAIPTATLCYSS